MWRCQLFVVVALLCLHCNRVLAEVDFSELSHKVAYLESFSDQNVFDRWIHSSDSKYTGRFTIYQPNEFWDDMGLITVGKENFYGLTSLLHEPLDPSKGFVIQFEVKHMVEIKCGGSYIKLLNYKEGFKAKELVESTPFSVMFGPDYCFGNAKTHVILGHTNHIDGKTEEKAMQDVPYTMPDRFRTHIYTLRVNADNTYDVLIDGNVSKSGSLLEPGLFEPPIVSSPMIPDPDDVQPEDWDERLMIPDPSSKKPDDWPEKMIPDPKAKKPNTWPDNEPETIPDPDAVKPEEWDDEEDGPWVAPEIINPKCGTIGCGKWEAPLVDNPKYKYWKPKMINNPAFKIWTIDDGYMFDSVVLAVDDEVPRLLREQVWKPKFDGESAVFEKAQAEELARGDAIMKSRRKTLARRMIKLFDWEPLIKVKPYAGGLIWALEKYPFTAWVIFSMPSVILILLIIWTVMSDRAEHEKQKARAAAAAVSGAAAPAGGDAVALKKGEGASGGGAAEETTAAAGKEGEEEEEEAPRLRRRARQAA